MLKRVSGFHETLSDGAIAHLEEGIRIADASFPAPFPRTLEYNAPAHGTWNIVHIGMAVPQSHSIYVCSDNCLRGVVMTAAEMGCRDRFSSVMLRERDVQVDNLETITIEGVSDVIRNLPKEPPVVFVFLVCLHIFTGSDEDYIFRELGRRFPQIRFVKGYMDCIRQKEGPTPDMKLRMAAFGIIQPVRKNPARVNLLGSDVPFDRDCELITLLSSNRFEVKQIYDCDDFEQFLALGDAAVNVCTYPNACQAVKDLSERTSAGFVYLSAAVSFDEIRAQIKALSDVCGRDLASEDWMREQERTCIAALQELAEDLHDWTVAIDYTAHSRPLGIAKLLIQHGIFVECVFLDAILEEEQEAFNWLKEHCPDLRLVPTVQPGMVLYGRGKDVVTSGRRVIALGQKAAWFCQSGHFVNIIEGGGLWGYQGIRDLCALLRQAKEEELDYKRMIPKKGIGWPSLCSTVVSTQPEE